MNYDSPSRHTFPVRFWSAVRNQIFRDRQVELVQLASTTRRIDHLEEDLQKNKDAKKLQSLGSVLGRDLQPHHCPTCDQLLADALLPQGTIDAVMPLDENIGTLRLRRRPLNACATDPNWPYANLTPSFSQLVTSCARRALRCERFGPILLPRHMQRRPRLSKKSFALSIALTS